MARRPIDERFAEFHREHPEVYIELVKLARVAKKQGFTKIGIRMLWEVARWNLFVIGGRQSTLKANDQFTSRYARLIMKQERDLRNIFRTRKLRAR